MRPPVVKAMALCLALLFCGPALAQTAQPARTLPDWSGLWGPLSGQAGFRSPLAPIPHTPEFKKRLEAQVKALAGQGGVAHDPTTNCEPPGMPRLMQAPYPVEFILEPQRVVILYENNQQVRRVWTDGRKLPPLAEVEPTYNGYSVGRWDGDTLVVDTIGLKESTLIDSRSFHSDALHINERFRRLDKGTMQQVVTLTDPKALVDSWSTTYLWKHEPTWEMKEYVCAENSRNQSKADGTSSLMPSK